MVIDSLVKGAYYLVAVLECFLMGTEYLAVGAKYLVPVAESPHLGDEYRLRVAGSPLARANFVVSRADSALFRAARGVPGAAKISMSFEL